jgi:hypothetical protein
LIELKKLDGVESAYLETIVFADARRIEPIGSMINILERPVGRE